MSRVLNVAARGILPDVVRQHVEDAAVLHGSRRRLAIATHGRLLHLDRTDERLAAHLDGIAVAGDAGFALCRAALEHLSASTVFVVAVRAIEDRQSPELDRLLAVADAVPDAWDGIVDAFAWVERTALHGIVAPLLNADAPSRHAIGLAACRRHLIDPGSELLESLNNTDPAVRVEALRTAGIVGRRAMVSTLATMQPEHPGCRFWAAWSAVLLGDREAALDELIETAVMPGSHRDAAFTLALQAVGVPAGRRALQRVAGDPSQTRWLIRGAGIVGDAEFVPWLIKQMAAPVTARLAGDAFTLITGADLARLDLERRPPHDFELAPNDDPEDENVDGDPDEGLPWPDVDRIAGWWKEHAHQFSNGTRYFAGAPVTREHCIDVLRDGRQPHRTLAAQHMCLLRPGTPLFDTSAPAWRQHRWLARLE